MWGGDMVTCVETLNFLDSNLLQSLAPNKQFHHQSCPEMVIKILRDNDHNKNKQPAQWPRSASVQACNPCIL